MGGGGQAGFEDGLGLQQHTLPRLPHPRTLLPLLPSPATTHTPPSPTTHTPHPHTLLSATHTPARTPLVGRWVVDDSLWRFPFQSSSTLPILLLSPPLPACLPPFTLLYVRSAPCLLALFSFPTCLLPPVYHLLPSPTAFVTPPISCMTFLPSLPVPCVHATPIMPVHTYLACQFVCCILTFSIILSLSWLVTRDLVCHYYLIPCASVLCCVWLVG